jgi:hypothetical protein
MRFLLAKIMTHPKSHAGQKIHRKIWRAASQKSRFQRTYEREKNWKGLWESLPKCSFTEFF